MKTKKVEHGVFGEGSRPRDPSLSEPRTYRTRAPFRSQP